MMPPTPEEPSDTSPSAPPRPRLGETLAQGAYRLRILLLGMPFLLAMVENARHPFPLWALAYEILRGDLPISPFERKLFMLPALGLYAGGFFLRLSATATLGGRTVWRLSLDSGRLHSEGLFGIVRHPIYLGSAAMILSLSLISSPQGAVLLTGIDIPLLVLFAWFEERHMSLAHPEYTEYKRQTPAVIPRLPLKPLPLHASWKALEKEGGEALRSEAANASLLGGFLAFWITPDLRFFWGSAGLALVVALAAPAWKKLFKGSP